MQRPVVRKNSHFVIRQDTDAANRHVNKSLLSSRRIREENSDFQGVSPPPQSTECGLTLRSQTLFHNADGQGVGTPSLKPKFPG